MPSKNIPVNGWPQIKELDKVAPILTELDKIEAWQKSVKQETKTGAEVTFTNALALAAVTLSAEIEASQDLHGYDHPWVGGAGKNKLHVTATSTTINGVTYTVNSDGTVTANNTATNLSPLKLGEFTGLTNVVLSGCPTGGGGNTYNLQLYDETASTWGSSDFGGEVVATLDPTHTYSVHAIVRNGVTVTNLLFKPMIRISGESSAFEPWENICPISGHTSVTITDYDSESNTATVTVQLGQTVYGGSFNLTTGVLTVDDISITFDGSNDEGWSRYNQGSASAYAMQIDNTTGNSDTNVRPMTNGASGLNSSDTYGNYDCFISTSHGANWIAGRRGISTVEDWKTWLTSNPIQVCYKLATPTTLQLTPEQLTMLKGYNRLSADTGDITVTAYTGNTWN